MMLPPTQQAAAGISTTLMQSMLDDIEQRRQEEEEKVRKTSDEDKILKAKIDASEVSAAANARINAHFFGALKRDENPMATLMARMGDMMGLTQAADESNFDFATRMEDALTMANLVTKTDVLGKPMKVGLATFKVTVEGLNAALDGTSSNPTAMEELLARFVTRNGLEQTESESDTDYKIRLGAALTAERSSLPASKASVEAKAGLRDLGITAEEMIEAIKRPYGDAAERIKTILDDKAAQDKTATANTAKVLQRLEDVADPKSEEELKVERTESDPTRVEDSETRQEREDDIQARQAAGKLDDVKDIQDAIGDAQETKAGSSDPDSAPTDALETIQVLAAGAEAAETVAQAENSAEKAGPSTATGGAQPDTGATAATDEDTEAAQRVMVARAGQAAQDQADETQAAAEQIFAISIDENGIYDYLTRKEAA